MRSVIWLVSSSTLSSYQVYFSAPADKQADFLEGSRRFLFSSVIGVAWCKYGQLSSADTNVWKNTVKSPCCSPQLCAHAPTGTQTHNTSRLCVRLRCSLSLSDMKRDGLRPCWEALKDISKYQQIFPGGLPEPGPTVCWVCYNLSSWCRALSLSLCTDLKEGKVLLFCFVF